MLRIATILAVLLAGSAAAQDEADAGEFCDSLHSLSTSLMRARQNGVSMATMMQSIRGRASEEFLRALVIEAYEVPRYSSDEYRGRAVEDFANDQYLTCVRTMGASG